MLILTLRCTLLLTMCFRCKSEMLLVSFGASVVLQNLGLSQDYKDSDSKISKWLKQSFGLHFLDAIKVEDCFVEDYMTSAPQDASMQTIWLKSRSQLTRGTHHHFSQRSLQTANVQTMLPSHFIAHFNAQFYSAHPSIFVFMDVIQKLQSVTYVKI